MHKDNKYVRNAQNIYYYYYVAKREIHEIGAA